MLDTKFIRKNFDLVEKALASRNADINLDDIDKYDKKRRNLLVEIEELSHTRNVASDKIAKMKKSGENAEDIIVEMRDVSEKIKKIRTYLIDNDVELQKMLLGIPNIPHESVPVGRDEADNELVKEWGDIPDFDFEIKAHWDIGEDLGILDFARAAKITGTRFPLYCGEGAKLERALIAFMLDMHIKEHGYKEILPPFIVNADSMTGTGQLPKFAEDLFKLENWNYYLIPTAEVPVTNIFRDEILDESMLPILYAAYTPCFRSEAGSHGKDTRGLIRQHQFNKVEMVKFANPDNSYEELESLLENAEAILKKLELPYRVVTLCTGDLGFSSAKTYDIEVWMPAQCLYREISSCSNFVDFQARRANIRFRRKESGKPEFVHTLNGSGLAVGRTFAAILENYQQPDGSVIIPDALKDYMGTDKIVHKK